VTAAATPMVDRLSAAPASVPRLLAGTRAHRGRMSLRAHLDWYGAIPRMSPGRLTEAVDQAGLIGRGGAGFPAARKLEAVARRRGSAMVVVNAMEGEPHSRKDAHLLSVAPHLALDGAMLAAREVGARQVLVAVSRDRDQPQISLHQAAAERRTRGADPVEIEVLTGPPRYVAGEETALVNWLNGGPARPLSTPPRPYQRGVAGRPTLVLNVETAAHVALIARYGSAWFRDVGTAEVPGTALVTVTGDLTRSGVAEVAVGTPLRMIVAAHEPQGEPVALLAGGYFGGWLPWSAAAGLTADPLALRDAGAGWGPGILIVAAEGTCVVAETARILRYLAGEGAGQCGPCVHGVKAVAEDFAELSAGRDRALVLERLWRRIELIDGRGACALPDGVRRLAESVLVGFAEHVAEHLQRGACTEARPLPLHLPPGPTGEADWR
jgi:NADH:ubiquinone oxidoreductase subunit F (NADH-binding)